ncbi:MAG: amino acid permease [Actinobacteria bacterium]|nr:amino acid permease [Actinomycetota bacterium]
MANVTDSASNLVGSPVLDADVPGGQGGVLTSPSAHLVDLPEPLSYRIKKSLLGPPLHTERLEDERLGRPTALAVFASDNLSSSAYATEEILRVLVPVVGVAAFSLVVPITLAMLGVLALLILSYRQTIKAYPSAGGAYIVTRDNFGIMPAQVAGVALLTDYILTVSVSVAAGTAALSSAFDGLEAWMLPISIVFVMLIAAVNLKGVRESGKAFSVPTYFFIANMFVLITVGLYRFLNGSLATAAIHQAGAVRPGHAGNGIFFGATIFVVLHAFASGGAAVTGVEAISNGVPAFREPAWKNARSTLVVMGTLLGIMFLGLSFLASKVHAMPFAEGTPTVISQIGELVYGSSAIGRALFYGLQAGTMLILVLAANTSFADFPRLASFHAGDNFMPRQLTKRGHRLVFSNGIIALAVTAIILLIITDAKVDRLIPLYAIGVFLSFTLSQAGMAKHHVTHREPKWQIGLFINGAGAFVSAVVCAIIAVTKFTHGAWAIIVIVPVLVVLLMRLNRQYELEETILGRESPTTTEPMALRRHLVLVLVDKVDLAASRAIQYARALTPDDLRAVHFDLDPIRTEDLISAWSRFGFARVPLDVVECPDRRIDRAMADLTARQLLGGETEVSVLLPRLEYSRFWHRLVHDRTADEIAKALSKLPHCNVTIVPFHLDAGPQLSLPSQEPADMLVAADAPLPNQSPAEARAMAVRRRLNGSTPAAVARAGLPLPPGMALSPERVPITEVRYRRRVEVVGKVYAMRVQPRSGVPTLEVTLVDDSGSLTIVFLGRRHLGGVRTGTYLQAVGVAGEYHGRVAILNPSYTIQPDRQ